MLRSLDPKVAVTVQVVKFRVEGLGLRVEGLGFRVNPNTDDRSDL